MNNELITNHIINNLIEVMSIAVEFSAYKESRTQNLQGSLQYYTGSEFPFFNGIFNNFKNQELPIQDDLPSIIQFFEEKNKPFIWWWLQQSEIPIKIKKELDGKGFQFLGNFLGIAAKLNEVNLNLTINNNIKIKHVENDQEYKTFLAIMCEVFQLSETIKNDLYNMYQSYGQHGKFTHYLAFYKNDPVATLTSYLNEKIVGLYNGATLPTSQKNGICTLLTQHALKEAGDLGCEYAVSQLMAPGMAKGLSEKLGFKTYCTLLPFLKNPQAA